MTVMTKPPGRARTRAQQRARGIRNTKAARRLVQLGMAGLIVTAAVRHQLEGGGNAASVDALCPFGAVETLITWVTTGSLISKTHPSNLVLGLAVLVATVLVGNAFCGWICPFGAVQDAITWLRDKLGIKPLAVRPAVDRALRYGRFVVLAVVLYFSVTTARLWFADYDPYLQLFGLHWLFEWNDGLWVGLGILAAVLVGSVLVDRMWCRYLCPLGAVFAVVGRLSFLRIRRNEATCTDCTLCDRPCPVGLTVSKADPLVSADCIGCMDCVAACPVKGALNVSGPVFVGNLLGRSEASRPSRPKSVPNQAVKR
ncbi:MAG: 4Fe-4S binding protein [Propionicimonas sp.]